MPTERVQHEFKHEGVVRDSMEVNIVSAEESIFSGRARVLIVPAELGEMGIYPGHSQLLTMLVPGAINLFGMDDIERSYYVSGGIMEIQPHCVTILADTVIRAEDIDLQRAEEARESAKKILTTGKKMDDYTAVLIELANAMAQLKAAKKRRR
ncbi:MAG: F0F1 ATP synthase subunit epsilon [Pseudomonadota bacterium]